VTRRLARARVIAAETQLRALDAQLDVDIHRWHARLRPSHLLAASFAAGFATVLLPRRWRMALSYSVGAIAWPLTRLFAPTILQNVLRQMDSPH
jgi:hypothetical protein